MMKNSEESRNEQDNSGQKPKIKEKKSKLGPLQYDEKRNMYFYGKSLDELKNEEDGNEESAQITLTKNTKNQ